MTDAYVKEATPEEIQHDMLGALSKATRRVEAGEVLSLVIVTIHREQCGDPDCPGMHMADHYRGDTALVSAVAERLTRLAADILPMQTEQKRLS